MYNPRRRLRLIRARHHHRHTRPSPSQSQAPSTPATVWAFVADEDDPLDINDNGNEAMERDQMSEHSDNNAWAMEPRG